MVNRNLRRQRRCPTPTRKRCDSCSTPRIRLPTLLPWISPAYSTCRRHKRTVPSNEKLEELDATHPGAPPRAMVLQDNSTPTNPYVFVRGNAGNHGPETPRQFLAVLSGEKRKPFEKGSGRLELAQAIA